MFRRMRMGWVQRTRERGPGSTATVQIFKSIRWPVESTHSPSGHTVRGGEFGSQRGEAGLRATDSLITNVCRGNEPLLYHQIGNRNFFIFITNQ